ncbi:BTB/POZ domain-containing protein 8 [Amphibalanus amphitrite]|nr:BTB/POZ domain-containing protein 8 [Amphibalanus amphitrite]
MGDGDCEPVGADLDRGPTRARPDVLPPATSPPPVAGPPPPPAEVARMQIEEKRKGSLLFNGSGCSSPERTADHDLGEVPAGRLWSDSARPDLVAGEERTDSVTGSPGRRPPVPLDEVPIVAGHHEPVTPTPLPPRRPPDSQHVFFVDLNELPTTAEPPVPRRPRHGSDSVYLYIDMNETGEAAAPQPSRRPAGDSMSLSFHGATAAERRPTAETDGDEDSEQTEASGRSLFYTVGETERPRRPPPELTTRVLRHEKRRRNLSLDCQARTEQERGRPAAPSPLVGADRPARPDGHASLGTTPEAARRAARPVQPRRQQGRPRAAAGTSAGRRPDSGSGRERDSLESVGPPHRPAASAPARRRSTEPAGGSSRGADRPPRDVTHRAQRAAAGHSGSRADAARAALVPALTLGQERESPETRNKQGIDQLTADLLQMLSDGLHADVTIQYFRDLLDKPHHNVIHIDGHKLETVEFVLFHLYSGAMYVPEDVDLSDLITLAVMLNHKALIRMAEFAMRVRLCHMFHKPCSECIPGVLETLCTAADCDLDDLAARCLAWVTQNRVAVWADPSFSEITDEYRAWCFQEAATLSQETVLDVLLDCRRLSAQLPAERWSQQVRQMVETLLSNSVVFLSRNLGAILVSDKFMSLAETTCCTELEQYLLAAADVQNSADAHTSLEMISQLQSIPNHGWDKAFLSVLQRIKQVCGRRASGGQNYASLHMQRRTVRSHQVSVASRPDGDSEEPAAPRARATSRPGSGSSAESRSPYLRRKHLLGLDGAAEPAAGGGNGARRQNVRGAAGEAMTQSVVAEPVSASAETTGMNRSESFTIYKHE